MAKGSVRGNSASDYVSGLGNPKAMAQNKRRVAAETKALLDLEAELNKKYDNDKEKAKKKFTKIVQNYEKKLNKETHEEKMKQYQEEFALSTNIVKKTWALTKANFESMKQATSNLMKSATAGLDSGISNYLGAYSNYMSGIETRLQGSTRNFSTITKMIARNVGSSQYVSQAKVLQNLNDLVRAGISNNVEQRAFLATVADRISTTFDAFDSNLSRIIRIQQADSTAARLGMEASLTQFFNENFGDTSYLSGAFKTVAQSLVGTSATLGKTKSVEFEYAVQKWLGSMASVGVSDSTLQQIAQGIGYLGTGDISSLSGNQSIQKLLLMAASKGGQDFGSIMTGGLTPAAVNTLLQNVVAMSKSIVTGTSNRVVLSEYSRMLGMDISDLVAMSNLTSDNLLKISNNMLEYADFERETNKQISNLGSRMTLKGRIDTMFENVMSTVGEGIANNAASYTTWILADMLKKSTGGIDLSIPVPLVGFKNINIADTVKTGIVGLNLLSNVGAILAGLSGNNNLSLAGWGGNNTVSKGQGLTGLITTGVSSTTSQTMFIGNAGESDLYAGSLAQSSENVPTAITGKETNLVDIIENDIAVNIRTIVQLLSTDGVVVRDNYNKYFEFAEGGGFQ